MSQRLSISVTFQALAERVSALEEQVHTGFPGQINAQAFEATNGAGQGFSILNPGNTTHTGYVALHNHLNARVGYIGFAPDNGPIPYVSENGQGHQFVGGQVTVGDDRFQLVIESDNPTLRFDVGDGIVFNRSANKYLFYVGGNLIASIDASGNMRLAGTLTQSTTP